MPQLPKKKNPLRAFESGNEQIAFDDEDIQKAFEALINSLKNGIFRLSDEGLIFEPNNERFHQKKFVFSINQGKFVSSQSFLVQEGIKVFKDEDKQNAFETLVSQTKDIGDLVKEGSDNLVLIPYDTDIDERTYKYNSSQQYFVEQKDNDGLDILHQLKAERIESREE